MKKILSVVFALMLLTASMTAAFAAPGDTGELTPFDLTVTGLIDATTDEWMGSSETRALLTVLLGLDLRIAIADTTGYGPLLNGSSFAGIGDGFLVVCMPTDTEGMAVVVVYFSELKTAYYMTAEYGDFDFEALFDIVMSELCTGGYWLNDPADIQAAGAEIAAILNE